jgi:hypothetical protein
MPRLIARQRTGTRAVIELRAPGGEIVQSGVTPEEYAALAVGVLPTRLVGDGEGWVMLRAASGMLVFDTDDGMLREGDWYPGDAEVAPLIGTASGATVAVEPGMILAWDGEDATLSPEATTMLADAQARGI